MPEAVAEEQVLAAALAPARALAGKAGPTLGAIEEQLSAGPLALLRGD